MKVGVTVRSSRTTARTWSSIARISSLVSGAVEREIEPEVVRRHERAGLPSPFADDVPQRPMEEVRAGVVAHRVRPAIAVDDRVDPLADAQSAVERAAMDDQPADRLLGVLDGEQRRTATRLPELAAVADLAAALGVERRSVEDDLGGPLARQLAQLQPVSNDRDDASFDRGGLVPDKLGVARPRLDRLVESAELGMLRELGLLARATPLALLGQGRIEALAIDRDAVLGRELDGEVDRKAEGVVEPEGDVAG